MSQQEPRIFFRILTQHKTNAKFSQIASLLTWKVEAQWKSIITAEMCIQRVTDMNTGLESTYVDNIITLHDLVHSSVAAVLVLNIVETEESPSMFLLVHQGTFLAH